MITKTPTVEIVSAMNIDAAAERCPWAFKVICIENGRTYGCFHTPADYHRWKAKYTEHDKERIIKSAARYAESTGRNDFQEAQNHAFEYALRTGFFTEEECEEIAKEAGTACEFSSMDAQEPEDMPLGDSRHLGDDIYENWK